MPEKLSHLKIDPFFSTKDYVYPKQGGGGDFPLVDRDRVTHGNKIIQELNDIGEQFRLNKAKELPEDLVRSNSVYVEFFSEWNFDLKVDSLHQDLDEPNYQVLNVKKELTSPVEDAQYRYRVVVMMREGAVSIFLKKAAEYLVKNTKNKVGIDTGLPSHRALINNIQEIKLATLQSFWSDEPEVPFPATEEQIWWEVWFRRTGNDMDQLDEVVQNLGAVGAQIGDQSLVFPEHVVKLVKATATQLSTSLILLDNLAELRKPQQLNDFITSKNIDIASKAEWVNDLFGRAEFLYDKNSVVICLLDSGVNNKHPLLINALPDERLYSYKTAWGTQDGWDDGGHGTGMAGLALYGDLTEALASQEKIKIYHGLESFKIVSPNDPSDPALYGAITRFACYSPVTDFPNNSRIYCLAITDKSLAFRGRPSAWSATIDKIAFSNSLEDPQLFIVSGGNVNYMLPQFNSTHYPANNLLESIHDPSQSYNALTVGSYTRMDRIDQHVFPGAIPLAANGDISPSNSTSLIWENQWPIKPDIVMEGGNLAVRGTAIGDNVPTLKPLSLDKDFTNYLLSPFGDTSGAAALASKLAAELKTVNPDFWPETIKALIVHSAEWTSAMLNGLDFSNATMAEKRTLLRTFGYGVPIIEKAFYSAQNSLTLIAENYIKPYKLEGTSVKSNEYHLYNLPWPVDILQNELTDNDVKLKVTLSYFIDPNPGNRRYANNFSYYSHSLDFKMIRPTEDLEQFKRRISGAEENQEVEYVGNEEPWALKDSTRNKGSIKKDFIISSGADLATRNIIAVFPKGGWYNLRKRLGKADSTVRYSLIVSVETERLDINIYNPVVELIQNAITN